MWRRTEGANLEKKPYAEIPGARANIGDKRSALQMQSVQNLLRLLPGVAFRIIELFGPFLGIFESMMEGPVRWTARTRVLHGRFGPTRLGRRVPSRSRAPHHRNNGYRRGYFGFHFCSFPPGSFCSVPPGSEDAVCRCSAGIQVQHDLALLPSNNSRGDGSVIRRSHNENLRTNWDAVIKIDNVIVGQTDAAG
jgi:hypothetical protein